MKKLWKTISIYTFLCSGAMLFIGCEPDDSVHPTPEKFEVSYEVTLKNAEDGSEFNFHKDHLEFPGSYYGDQGEGYMRINVAAVLDSISNSSIDVYIYADSSDHLIPLGESYDLNPDNNSEMIVTLNGDRYVSNNTSGTAVHSIADVTYYSKIVGKVTYRYEFENVTVIRETGSPETYIASGHIICKAEE